MEEEEEEEEEEDEEFEIPYSAALSAALAAASTPADREVEVRLWREGQGPLGLVLDATNYVVALRHGTPGAAAFDEGRLHVGDQVLSVCGVACSEQRRVGEVLRELGAKQVFDFRLRRSAEPPAHLPTGAALRDELEKQHAEQRQQRQQQQQNGAGRPAGPEAGGGRQLSLEEAMAQAEAEGGEVDAKAKARLWPMWRRQARQPLQRRLSAAEMLRQEGNAKFSAGDFEGALREYAFALEMFEYEVQNLVRSPAISRHLPRARGACAGPGSTPLGGGLPRPRLISPDLA